MIDRNKVFFANIEQPWYNPDDCLEEELYLHRGGEENPTDVESKPRDLYYDTDCIRFLVGKLDVDILRFYHGKRVY